MGETNTKTLRQDSACLCRDIKMAHLEGEEYTRMGMGESEVGDAGKGSGH